MKTLIFDRSGTLHDNFSAFCEVFYAIMDHFGAEKVSKEQIRKTIRAPYLDFWQLYLPKISFDELETLYNYYILKTAPTQAYPSAKETIDFLYKQGYRLFIISSDIKEKLIDEAQKADILNYFEEVITDIHYKDQRIIQLIKEKNIDTSDCYYIGDTIGDVEAAKKAGIKTIAIAWGFQDKSKLIETNPDIVIDDLIELKNI